MNKTETIAEFFEKDHREIDAILESVEFAADPADLKRFETFVARLERHIGWEEDRLFPAAGDAAPGIKEGPIRVMLAEHVEIKARLAKALTALRAGRTDEAREAAEDARRVLEVHNRKEEMILYPLCDQAIEAPDKLVASLPGR